MRSGLYYLVAPSTGSANVVIAIASSSDASAMVTEYRNIDQGTPFSATTSAKNKNNAPSITIASNSNEVVVSSIGTIQENPNPASGITVIGETSSNNSYNNFSRKTGAASITMSYTFASGNADDWVIVAGSLQAATTGLPVELAEFSGIQSDNRTVLTWSTANEVNNDYFEIEKSFDGKNFISFAKINGNGTSNNYNHYNLEDDAANDGFCYYRLIQYDFDGTKTIHKTIIIENRKKSGEKMIANSFNNSIQFSKLDENSTYSISVYNSAGIIVFHNSVNVNTLINLSDLNSGMYVISLVKNSSEVVLSESTVVH